MKLSTINMVFCEKRFFGPSFIISSFSKLLFHGNFLISNKNSLKMSEIDKHLQTLELIRSIFSHFPTEVLKYSLKT